MQVYTHAQVRSRVRALTSSIKHVSMNTHMLYQAYEQADLIE